MSTIGQRINECRKKMNVSADDVAAELGVSRSTIFRYENGDIRDIPITIIEPLAKTLNTTPAHLVGWDEESDKTNQTNLGCSNIRDILALASAAQQIERLLRIETVLELPKGTLVRAFLKDNLNTILDVVFPDSAAPADELIK